MHVWVSRWQRIEALIVNILCQLDWVMNMQIFGETVFLSVSIRVLLDEISISMQRLCKADLPRLIGPDPALSGIKVSLDCFGAGTSVFSCFDLALECFRHYLLWFSGPWTLPELYHQYSCIFSLLTTEHRFLHFHYHVRQFFVIHTTSQVIFWENLV